MRDKLQRSVNRFPLLSLATKARPGERSGGCRSFFSQRATMICISNSLRRGDGCDGHARIKSDVVPYVVAVPKVGIHYLFDSAISARSDDHDDS